MENHVKIYYNAFGYDLNQIDKIYIQSELSDAPYNDIHHIISRGKKGEDRIENLMAVTRTEHEKYGDRIYLIPMLLKIHRAILRVANVKHDNNWFEFYINYYQNLTDLKK